MWGVTWTPTDEVISVSADGTIKKWHPTSAQVSLSRPAHPLAIVSIDVSADGRRALYNTLEGLTCLWDLENGEVIGKHESYVRESKETIEPGESCICAHKITVLPCLGILLIPAMLPSLVCVNQPQEQLICRDWRVRERHYPFSRPSIFRRATCYTPQRTKQIWYVLQTCGLLSSVP